ncbi:hypothetical protein [Streptomyces sp. NBC_01190]|uniref:hypothetical protein n=1 Tax=Streptomyces sp. NBC_01190 TaxID=2903767 RepID=UPI003864F58C|nr:hypothetical protein OG519_28880 [Streptomyces sp. NBC_01190]
MVFGSASAQDAPSSVGLQVSYDDGASRHRADLKRKNDTWTTSLGAPSHAGYVSIRVTAEQRNGHGVTQTVGLR